MTNTFDWVEIWTKEIERTADFFKNLFGWEIIGKDEANGSEVWIFDTGDKPRLEKLQMGGLWSKPKGESTGVVVYIVVESIDEILNRVEELGGKIIIPKTSQGLAYRACFSDPSGNVFGLWEERNTS